MILMVVVLCLAVGLTACNNHKGEIGGGLWQGKPQNPDDNVDTPSNPPTPDDPIELAVPSGLTVSNDGLLSWKRVSGADGYDIQVNDVLVENRKLTSLSLVDLENLPADGVFRVKVRALRGEEKSDWSNPLTYTHQGKPMVYPTLSYQDGKVVWIGNPQAKQVSVKVNGNETLLAKDAASFDLTDINTDADIIVKFVGDGVYILDSKEVKVRYVASTKKLYLPAPTNVKMNGSILTFDEVLGANIYYLQDVNNTITQITELSSDRSNKFLVKAIWAGNTDIDIENSESTGVEYFSSEKGTGTESDPFIISTPGEMRYIEYYESINEAKYYKLANDIVLEEYKPKDDEDYSNFYNLGSLSGVIDGDGHALVNTTVYYKDGYSSIFDSIATSGVIKNLVIENAAWRTWTVRTNDGIFHEKGGECAILAFTNRGTIQNVTVKNSTVHAVKDGAAGLVAINKGTITGCVIDANSTVYGANEAGGIAILNSGIIKNCKNFAPISGNIKIGGIAARNNGVITECGNEGEITANTYAGGIVGYNYNIFDEQLLYKSTVSYCYNLGNVDVTSYGGGIAGKNGGDGINEVGVMSHANASILSCYSIATITGANSLGGIVGDNYGYHEKDGDLGVVNCYSGGSISVDVDRLKATRVYLDISGCSWATLAEARFYVHFWSPTESSSWPGIRMTETTIGSKTYYYADIAVSGDQLDGLIFNRVSPTGDIWNQTPDIKSGFAVGKLCYTINENWNGGAFSYSQSLVSGSKLSVGGVAGFNNMINDCYYLKGTVGGKTLEAGASSGTQYNKIMLNGSEVTSSACAVDDISELLSKLNSVNNVWVLDGNKPILKWQKE